MARYAKANYAHNTIVSGDIWKSKAAASRLIRELITTAYLDTR